MTITAAFSKPYFNYNPADGRASEFASHLIADMGDYKAEESDIIVNIGGDGTILWAFHQVGNVNPDAPYFALKPPGSRSTLHNGHHNIENAADLKRAFSKAQISLLPVLKAEIALSDGTTQTICALQDIVIKSFNSQAVLPQIFIDGELKEEDMNCGIVVTTPLGSTGINETHGGQILSLDADNIALTHIGITNPAVRQTLKDEGRLSRKLEATSRIDLSVSPTGTKRLTSIDFDNRTMMPDGQIFDPSRPITVDTTLKHIRHIGITIDPTEERKILFNPEYRTPNGYD